MVVTLLVVPATSCLGNYQDGFYLCSGAHLTEIPDDIPPDAEEVYLHNNNIGQLEADAFSGLSASQWEVLSFSMNGIIRIEPGAFNGLHSLRDLYLDENQTSSVTPETWQGLPVLESLHLKDNRISELKANQWVGL